MSKKHLLIGLLAVLGILCSMAYFGRSPVSAEQGVPKFAVVNLYHIAKTVSGKEGAIKTRFEKAEMEYTKEVEGIKNEEKEIEALREEALIFNPGSEEHFQKSQEYAERAELLEIRKQQLLRSRDRIRSRLENEVVEQLIKIIRQYAVDNNYDYIFRYNDDISQGIRSLIFASKAQDITEEVLKVVEKTL